MKKTAVLNVVGLTRNLIGDHTPRLRDYLLRSSHASVGHVTPAVTCSVQATYLTGTLPEEHGIVANGWYARDEAEVKFWKQADGLVQRPRVWETAKGLDPTFTCANLFWWHAMYSRADVTVTPRPIYRADGRKLPDIWTNPPDLRQTLQRQLGPFPLFKFWGPAASIESTRWIADAALLVETQFSPTLSLIYLPHLDYVLQREGSAGASVPRELAAVDAVAGRLIDAFESARAAVIVLSEYGIAPVDQPIHLNRVFRQAGLLQVRDELGGELLDAGASAAFAVADHQVAHVYVGDPADRERVRELIEATAGVDRVEAGEHPRAGDWVVSAKPNAWFTYYYWFDDDRAPDFARTVDIHRKPGYDPAELFMDPTIRLPAIKIGRTLLKKAMGFRYLMDVIPLDASLVKGSHGVVPASAGDGPIVITRQRQLVSSPTIEPTQIHDLILSHLQRE